jgi:hypothetical protein
MSDVNNKTIDPRYYSFLRSIEIVCESRDSLEDKLRCIQNNARSELGCYGWCTSLRNVEFNYRQPWRIVVDYKEYRIYADTEGLGFWVVDKNTALFSVGTDNKLHYKHLWLPLDRTSGIELGCRSGWTDRTSVGTRDYTGEIGNRLLVDIVDGIREVQTNRNNKFLSLKEEAARLGYTLVKKEEA